VRTHSIFGVLVLAGAAAVVGCSGGGASRPPTPTLAPGGSVAPAARGKATFTLTIPSASGTSEHARTPKYISPNTQSIAISVAAGTASPGPATTANLTPSSPNCTTASGNLVCTIVVPAPVGTDTFAVTLYSGIGETGSILSSATMLGTVADNAANTIPITLNGVVASITVSIPGGNDLIPGGYATTLPVVVTAQDASGATIVGPGSYANPIALANADTSGVTTLSTTTVSGPSTAVTLTYGPNDTNTGVLNVAGLPVGETQISASATGVAPTATTAGTFQYIADRFWGFGTSRTMNGSGTVTVTSYNNAGSPLPSPSAYAFTIANTTVVHAGVTFNGVTTSDTTHADTYTITSPAAPGAETFTQDQYRAHTLTSTGSIFYFYGTAVTDVVPWSGGSPITGNADGTTQITTTYPTPGAWVDDVLPHAATTWSNTGIPFTQTFANAETATFQYGADGSTSFSETAPSTISWSASPTGTATNANGGVSTTVGTPVPTASPASTYVIPVAQQTTSPSPGPVTNSNAADWYPGGAQPVQPLWQWNDSESYVAIPAACNVPSTVATEAWEIAYQQSQIRVGSFQDRQWTQSDYFVPGGIGWVCEIYSETDTNYRFKTGTRSSQTVLSYVYGVTSASDLSIVRKKPAATKRR
jgi:hypothetical protein